MPNIPIIEQKTRPSPSFDRTTVSAAAMGGGIGDALKGLGSTFGAISADMRVERDKADRLKAKNLLLKHQTDYIKGQEARQIDEANPDNRDADLNTFADRSQKGFIEGFRAEAKELGISDKAMAEVDFDAQKTGLQIFGQEQTFIARERVSRNVETVKQNMDYASNLVTSSPALYDEMYAKADETVADYPGAEKGSNRSAFTNEYKAHLTTAKYTALYTDINSVSDAAAFIKDLKTDERVKNDLTPSQVTKMIAGAESKQETLKTKNTQYARTIVEDSIARLSMGGEADSGLNAAINVLGKTPAKRERLTAQVSAARKMGVLTDTINSGTPESAAAVVNDMMETAKNGTKFDTAVAMSAIRLNAKRNKDLEADSLTFVRRNSEEVKGSAERLSNAESSGIYTEDQLNDMRMDHYDTLVAAQVEQNISKGAALLLPPDDVDKIEAEFKGIIADPKAAADKITALQDRYDDHWPRVYRQIADKIPSEALVALDMVGTTAVTTLLSLSSTSTEDLFGGDSKKARQVSFNIHTKAKDAAKVYAGGSLGAKSFVGKVDAATRLAANYITSGNMNASAAEDKAVADVFGKYKYSDTFVVPEGYNAELINSGLKNVKRNLNSMDFYVVGGDDNRAAMIRAISDTGVLINDGADNEGKLRFELSNGDWAILQKTVVDDKGNSRREDVVFKYEDLEVRNHGKLSKTPPKGTHKMVRDSDGGWFYEEVNSSGTIFD